MDDQAISWYCRLSDRPGKGTVTRPTWPWAKVKKTLFKA